MNIQDRLSAIEKTQQECVEAAAALEKQHEPLNRMIGDLQEAIQRGETTGDPIRDYCLFRYFGSDEHFQNLTKLDQALKNNVGQLLMLVSRMQEPLIHRMIPGRGSDPTHTSLLLHIMIIEGGLVVEKDKEGGIPTCYFLSQRGCHVNPQSGKIEIESAGIKVMDGGTFNLTEIYVASLNRKQPLFDERFKTSLVNEEVEPGREFCIGNDDVETFFKVRHKLQFLRQITKKLQINLHSGEISKILEAERQEIVTKIRELEGRRNASIKLRDGKHPNPIEKPLMELIKEAEELGVADPLVTHISERYAKFYNLSEEPTKAVA